MKKICTIVTIAALSSQVFADTGGLQNYKKISKNESNSTQSQATPYTITQQAMMIQSKIAKIEKGDSFSFFSNDISKPCSLYLKLSNEQLNRFIYTINGLAHDKDVKNNSVRILESTNYLVHTAAENAGENANQEKFAEVYAAINNLIDTVKQSS